MKKSLIDHPYALTGHLCEVGANAISKEIEKLCTKEGADPAYYSLKLTLDLSELSPDFVRMNIIRISNTFDWNVKER